MSIKPDQLKKIVEELREDLGEGFVATDIWATGDSKSLLPAGDQKSPPGSIELFNEVTQNLGKALQESEIPGIGSYYLINLANSHLAVLLSMDAYQQLILVNLSKTTMGILMSIALPNLFNSLANATKQPRSASGLWGLLNTWSMGLYDNKQG